MSANNQNRSKCRTKKLLEINYLRKIYVMALLKWNSQQHQVPLLSRYHSRSSILGAHVNRFFAGVAGISVFAFVGSASAADMPMKAPPVVPPAPVYSWTGFYAGIGLGSRTVDVDGHVNSGTNNGVPLVNASASCPTPSPSCPGLSFNETAFRVSGYLGYNWQFAPQ